MPMETKELPLRKGNIMKPLSVKLRFAGGVFLITGMTIGVGMLSLPISTAVTGFIPSLLNYFICWLFMMGTGLMILETVSRFPPGSNFITLYGHILGRWGELACWALFLFLFPCLMVAHTVAGGKLLCGLLNYNVTHQVCIIAYVIPLAAVIYRGIRSTERLNTLLVLIILVLFIWFTLKAIGSIQLPYLQRNDWTISFQAIPIFFTAYAYKSIIPTTYRYLDYDTKKTKRAIMIGITIPFILFVVWELLILGIIPLSALVQMQIDNSNFSNTIFKPLHLYLHDPLFEGWGRFLMLLVSTTSYLCIAIAFSDFLHDGLKLRRHRRTEKEILALAVFIPAFVALVSPHLLVYTLAYIGGVVTIAAAGFFPVILTYAARKRLKNQRAKYLFPGGKPMLALFIGFVIIITLATFAF
jgi:tyrosine-specific transport protein